MIGVRKNPAQRRTLLVGITITAHAEQVFIMAKSNPYRPSRVKNRDPNSFQLFDRYRAYQPFLDHLTRMAVQRN